MLREFENRWRRLRNLRDSNPKVFSIGLTSLYSSVAETAAAIEIAGWDYSEYEELTSELLSGIRDIKTLEERAFANSIRKYQRWALDNIKIFTTNTDTDNLNRKIDNLIKCIRGETQFRYLDWHDEVPEISAFVASINYKKEPGSIYGENETFLYNNTSFKLEKIREECGHAILSAFMIKRLIPIDTTNLELPVLEMYQNAFENAFGLLDATLYQTAVAESTVETVKVTPAAFWEAMK